MKHIYSIIVLLIISSFNFSCSDKTIEPDPALIGKWTDKNVLYNFNSDKTYYMLYLRDGQDEESIDIDSIFGTFTMDNKRSNITFEVKGYMDSDEEIINKPLNATTWNYQIVQDSILKYESRTILGQLKRVK